MIDFACKRFKLDEVIKCGLGLTKADLKVLQLLRSDVTVWCTAEDISQKLSLDLSTAQRALKKLTEKGVVDRRQDNLEGGGYIYRYSIKPKKEVREVVMRIVTRWANTVEEELKKW